MKQLSHPFIPQPMVADKNTNFYMQNQKMNGMEKPNFLYVALLRGYLDKTYGPGNNDNEVKTPPLYMYAHKTMTTI